MQDTDTAAVIADLQAQIDELRHRLAVVADAPAPDAERASTEPTANRRALLKLAGAAAVGTVASAAMASRAAAEIGYDGTQTLADAVHQSQSAPRPGKTAFVFKTVGGQSDNSSSFPGALGGWSYDVDAPNGVYGYSDVINGCGVVGSAAGISGIGVSGVAPSVGVHGTAATGVLGDGINFGVIGSTSTTNGVGTWGQTIATGGQGVRGVGIGVGAVGVRATGEGTNATGVDACGATTGVKAVATEATSVGVHATAASQGVFGRATGANGTGVVGDASGTGGVGVSGSGPRAGVSGVSLGANAVGVRGSGTGQTALGGSFVANGAGSAGLDATGEAYGLVATAIADSGTGVYGTGQGTDGWGVLGLGTAYGVVGRSSSSSGAGGSFRGVNGAIVLITNQTGAPPTRSRAYERGAIEPDPDGGLWYCCEAGTPGTWRKLSGATTAGAFHPLAPGRVYDSREALPSPGALFGGQSRTISVADKRNPSGGAVTAANFVPAGATAVAANVTVVSVAGGGFLACNPGGTTEVTASTINWSAPDQAIANGVILTLNTNRELTIVAGGGTTHFLVDITGYWL